MILPTVESYGRHSGRNYGTNSLRFTFGPVVVYFSYRTPIAFSAPGAGLVVRENDWGPTTGKHLNRIDGGGVEKANRIPGPDFERQLAAAVKGESRHD